MSIIITEFSNSVITTQDGKTNKHLATTDRHRGGDAPDRKPNKH